MFENFRIKKIGFEAVVTKAIYTYQFNFMAPTLLTEDEYNALPDNWKINCEVYIDGVLQTEEDLLKSPQTNSTEFDTDSGLGKANNENTKSDENENTQTTTNSADFISDSIVDPNNQKTRSTSESDEGLGVKNEVPLKGGETNFSTNTNSKISQPVETFNNTGKLSTKVNKR